LTVCVAGLGEVGLPAAEYIAEKGLPTYGYDVDMVKVDRAKKNGIISTTCWEDLPHNEIKVYILCVSTGWGQNGPILSAVLDVCQKISLRPQPPYLVSIESTVPFGTCRMLAEKIFRKKVYLVHVPHRYWKEDPVRYGVRQPRVIGGINKQSLMRGINFYSRLKIPIFPVSNIEVAELSKLVENSYRFVQISFAEQMKIICDSKGIDFEELRKAVNTKWNVDLLEAREGIGGHCLPKDIRYLIYSAGKSTPLLEGAILADRMYQWYLKHFDHFIYSKLPDLEALLDA